MIESKVNPKMVIEINNPRNVPIKPVLYTSILLLSKNTNTLTIAYGSGNTSANNIIGKENTNLIIPSILARLRRS